MPDFNDFAKDALDSIQDLVKNEFNDHSQEALKDARDFLEGSRQDLQRWLQLAAAGQLTASDLTFLIQGKKDLARMFALKRAGVALARLQRFQTALVGIAVDTATAGLGQLANMAAEAIPTMPTATRSRPAPAKKKKAAQSSKSAKAARTPAKARRKSTRK